MATFNFDLFWARGDSNTANNSSINSINTNSVPVTSLQFVWNSPDGSPEGDIILDYENGLIDPNTQVLVGGSTVPQDFTLELSGRLPFINKLSNVAGQDIRNLQVAVITTESGQRFFFLYGTDIQLTDEQMIAVMNAFPNGSIPVILPPVQTDVVVCFAAETLIDTPEGPRAAGELHPGDLVETDLGPQPLLWVGRRHVGREELRASPHLAPVEFAPGSLAPDAPRTTLRLSPAHRVLLEGWRVELLTGEACAFAPAGTLINGTSIRRVIPPGGVTYIHLMLDSHRILYAHGVSSESFEPGPRGLFSLDPETRREIEALFGQDVPDTRPAAASGPMTLKRHQTQAILGS